MPGGNKIINKRDTLYMPVSYTHLVYTPGTKTIKDVCDYLGVDEKKTIKALMFTTFDQDLNPADYVCVFIRGDRDVNMIKLVNALGIPCLLYTSRCV